jgi:hypothetical protein
MKSFIDNGHTYDLFSYDAPSVPDGVRLRDARDILPKEEIFYYQRGDGKGSVSCFTNNFRYRLLMEHGGWWVDTDVLCLSNKIPEGDIFIERESHDTIGTAVIKFPKGHPLVCTLYEKSVQAGKDVVWGQTGPTLLTNIIKDNGLWDTIYPPQNAFPLHYSDALLPVTVTERELCYQKTSNASFLHLWNEIFRRNNSNELNDPAIGSFLADYYAKHNIV